MLFTHKSKNLFQVFLCRKYGKGILAKSEARRQRFAGCPPSPSEPAVSYLNTSYKFFVPRLWKRSGGLGREKSPQWRRGTLERSSTQSKLERRGLKKDPRILDKERRVPSPVAFLRVIGFIPARRWLSVDRPEAETLCVRGE